MAYEPTTNPKFLQTVEAWLCSQREILVLIRYSHAAGQREFEFFSSFQTFLDRVQKLPALACVTVFKEKQLPLRDVVDDKFIAGCLEKIPNGKEFLIAETERRVAGRMSWFHHGSGESHAELRDELEESRGAPVAVGLYPPWLVDSNEVISAVAPDEHGVAQTGIY